MNDQIPMLRGWRSVLASRWATALVAVWSWLLLDPIDEERVFPINAWTLGYVSDLAHGNGIDVGLGGQFTIHDVPADLDRYYSDDIPLSFQVFLRVRPSLMAHQHEMPAEK